MHEIRSFDDISREYVVDTPRTPYPRGLTTSAVNSSSASSAIPPAALVASTMPDCAASPIPLQQHAWTTAAATSTSRMATQSGTPAGSPSKRSWTATPAATAWATIITGQKNGLTASQLSFVPMGVNAPRFTLQVTLRNDSDAPRMSF